MRALQFNRPHLRKLRDLDDLQAAALVKRTISYFSHARWNKEAPDSRFIESKTADDFTLRILTKIDFLKAQAVFKGTFSDCFDRCRNQKAHNI